MIPRYLSFPKIVQPRLFVGQTDYVRPFNHVETQEFLSDNADLRDTIDLWNQYAGIRGLLEGSQKTQAVQHARHLVEVYFDFATGRYRYIISNKLVPIGRVRLGVLRVSNAKQLQMRDLTVLLIIGTISKDLWYRRMRTHMLDQYRASWIASIGGVQNYDKRQQALFGRAAAPQYRWLDNFLDQLNTGRQFLDGSAVIRAGMYSRAGNAIYQNNLLAVARANGFRMARRILGENENHCVDSASRSGCIELAAIGWVNIDTIVQISNATCLTNCLCVYEFRKS